MEASQLAQMMSESFATQQNFLLSPLNCKTNFLVSSDNLVISADLPKIQLNVSPCIFDDLNNFI